MNIRRNVIKQDYTFVLHFPDGRTEQATVRAESFSAAVLALPRFAEVGPYRYTLSEPQQRA